jgi:DNA invertase Pin-like site-specific DNA recombinase
MEQCNKKNIPISKIIEQVRSGRKDRKELVNIVQNELTKGDVIVVYSISRFARSQKQVHNLVDVLMKKKCRLLTVAENMDTLEDDKFLGIYAWVAEMESKQIAERVSVSLQSKRLRGEHLGNVPYGYHFLEGKGSPLVKNEEEQRVIEMMRAWRKEGKSFYEITHKVNQMQIEPPKRRKDGWGWNDKTIKLIIERDDSKILLKVKRSWYRDQDQPTEEETVIETFERLPTPTVEREKLPDTDSDLSQKPVIVIRSMLMKRRKEVGLTEEEIRALSKEDMIEILSI